jgi:enoyl-CoA hydratase
MTDPVSYAVDGNVAVVTVDDGKANALTLEVFAAVREALERADADGLGVTLAGRDGRFSAGFDLSVLTAGGPDAARLVRTGFELLHRMLSFPRPLVIACTGHAYAMGSFLLLAADHRIGVTGTDHRITANEVAIGITMPRAAIEVCRHRLTPAAFERAVVLAAVFSHEEAVAAGFLDELVAPGALLEAAHRKAGELVALHPGALAATKLRARGPTLDALRAAIDADDAELRASF